MADIQTIAHGEPNWDSKVNANFRALVGSVQNVGGVVKGLSWSERTNAGIVLTSGFAYSPSSANGYETLKIGGKTIVHLTLNLTCTEAFHGAGHGVVITIPESIGFEYLMDGLIGSKYTWTPQDGTHIRLGTINDQIIDWDTGNALYTLDALYVKNS